MSSQRHCLTDDHQTPRAFPARAAAAIVVLVTLGFVNAVPPVTPDPAMSVQSRTGQTTPATCG